MRRDAFWFAWLVGCFHGKNTLFLGAVCTILQRSIYQDRLGTNIGKKLRKGAACVFCRQGGVTIVCAMLAVAALYICQILENTNPFFIIGLFIVFSLAQTAFGLMLVSLGGRDVDPKVIYKKTPLFCAILD